MCTLLILNVIVILLIVRVIGVTWEDEGEEVENVSILSGFCTVV